MKKYKFFYIIILILILIMNNISCRQTKNKMVNYEYTNHLINETSPYLLQHSHNPVDWYPWSKEALTKAKNENKMLLISIGYAACHWCHVMEKESFTDTAVANFMNQNFVCIKIDREERPDIDQIYMNAAYLINGRGGWPLNALALADGKPFFAGTYFPKKDWIKMLQYFVDIKKQNPQSLITQADNVTKGINSIDNLVPQINTDIFTISNLKQPVSKMKEGIDFIKGGGTNAPKFPMPSNWEFLLHYYYLTADQEALKGVITTLNNMAAGGIYDQIGGGFSRYSTDKNWHIPHFEKMLYDNAQLISLYSNAYKLTKNEYYKEIVYQTIEFIERELSAPEGGFYSSLDADSEGEEGKFYAWTKKEVETILGTDAPMFIEYYNITESGNWENKKNIIFTKLNEKEIAAKYNLSLPEFKTKIENDRNLMLKLRLQRISPNLDDKSITAWNALMIKAYISAYRTFHDENFLNKAVANANFLLKTVVNENNEIMRNYKNKKATINGFLDDYAFVISAFIELYQATFDVKWLNKANEINHYTITHFFDTKSGMFYYSHNQYSNLIARKMEIADNVIPSSNSEIAKNLFLLGNYFSNDSLITMSKQMLNNVKDDMYKNLHFYSNWAILELYFDAPFYEIAIVGDNFKTIKNEFDNFYLPNSILLGTSKNSELELLDDKLIKGQTTIYVCFNKACLAPVTETKKAIEFIKKE